MRVIKFVNKKSQRLSEAICDYYSFASYNFVQKLLRNRDIKVDGKRVAKDIIVSENSTVEFYFADKKKEIKILFEDENIIIAIKPRQLETTVEDNNISEDTLQSILEKQIGSKIFAVHRLDRNTEGLVIFAKNERAKLSLDEAIKNRKVKKFYLALVNGKVNPKQAKCKAYLKKDAEKSLVYITDKKVLGFFEIETDYKLIKQNDETALLEVYLVTGKTHQIRAHLSHLGFPIVGDEKYGDSLINKKFKKRFQCLCAYKLIFNLDSNDYLSYLNGKVFELETSKIDFCKNM